MGRARGGQATAASGNGASRRPGPKGPWKWTDERIRSDLSAFLAARGRPDWPTNDEFRAAGLAGLAHAITTYGRVPYWAAEMGVELGPRQNREPLLAVDAVRLAEALIAEHGELPGIDTLRELGHIRLSTLVRRHGGSKKFCEAFGLSSQPRS
jgi:hypothetical protein